MLPGPKRPLMDARVESVEAGGAQASMGVPSREHQVRQMARLLMEIQVAQKT